MLFHCSGLHRQCWGRSPRRSAPSTTPFARLEALSFRLEVCTNLIPSTFLSEIGDVQQRVERAYPLNTPLFHPPFERTHSLSFPSSPALSLGALRQGAQSKVQQVPTLPQVLPYLELSYKQEYLVQRITGKRCCPLPPVLCMWLVCASAELAQGSYISAYRWKSGGSWKGRTWDQDLPNDSQV